MKRGSGMLVGVAGSAAIAIGTTVASGTPKRLPSVALESAAILHVERAAIVFWALVVLLVVVYRAATGELPVELSTTSARYREAVVETGVRVEEAITELNARLDEQEALLADEFAPRIERLEGSR